MPHFFRRPVIALPVAMLVGLGSAQAQTEPTRDLTPKYSNDFLSIGVGGRALAMGGTQVSLAQDATAGYWNPAGLLNQKNKYDAVVMHSELFAGIVKNEYAAGSMKLDDRSALGVSLIRVAVDDIPDTRSLINEYNQISYDRVNFFSVADYGLLLSYARQLGATPGLQVGANAKVIYRQVGKFGNAWGFGIDAGAQYEKAGWRLGLMARDVTTTFNVWSMNPDEFKPTQDTLDYIPRNSTEITLPRFVLGVSRAVKLPAELTAVVALDLEMTTDGKRNTPIATNLVSVAPHLGAELGYKNIVFLRGGATNVQRVRSFDGADKWKVQPTLGLGLAFSGLRLDLALSRLAIERIPGSSSQTNSIMVSLGYGIK